MPCIPVGVERIQSCCCVMGCRHPSHACNTLTLHRTPCETHRGRARSGPSSATSLLDFNLSTPLWAPWARATAALHSACSGNTRAPGRHKYSQMSPEALQAADLKKHTQTAMAELGMQQDCWCLNPKAALEPVTEPLTTNQVSSAWNYNQ